MTTEELIHAIKHEWPCGFVENGYLRWVTPDGTVLPGKLKMGSAAGAKAAWLHYSLMAELAKERRDAGWPIYPGDLG